MREEDDEYVRKQDRCYDVRGRRHDPRNKHRIVSLSSLKPGVLGRKEEVSHDDAFSEICDRIDAGVEIEERPVPYSLRGRIAAKARAMKASRRWTDLRCKELAVSAIYLASGQRPIRKGAGLPCSRKCPSMWVLMPELQIEI